MLRNGWYQTNCPVWNSHRATCRLSQRCNQTDKDRERRKCRFRRSDRLVYAVWDCQSTGCHAWSSLWILPMPDRLTGRMRICYLCWSGRNPHTEPRIQRYIYRCRHMKCRPLHTIDVDNYRYFYWCCRSWRKLLLPLSCGHLPPNRRKDVHKTTDFALYSYSICFSRIFWCRCESK